MFTGIIKDIGKVVSMRPQGAGYRMAVETGSAAFKDLIIDESVSISGACQTVVAVKGHIFEVDTVEETLKKSTLGTYTAGTPVNLERALRPLDRMGGHIVQGHVDCTGTVVSIDKKSASWIYRVAFDTAFEPFIVAAGSIAVDGISLTVADVSGTMFSLSIIPFTFRNTTFYEREAGDKVNLEFDVLAKYIQKQLRQSHTAAAKPEMTEAWLRGLGY
ncbi:MAG: riboflavin synthase [Rhizobacter sp.]|nr:riboflavin synthase [Chlorobiales bacterium]